MEPSAEIAGVFTAIGAAGNNVLFLAQVPLMRKIMREGSSDAYSWMPSLTLCGSMTLWSAYTVFVVPTVQLYIANFPGMILPALYLCVFATYASSWAKRGRILAAGAAVLVAGWGFSAALFAGGGVSNAGAISGGVTTCVSLLFFLSPLAQLRVAVRELDISRVPVALSAVQCVQSAVWIFAAYHMRDGFIVTVNSAGLAFGALQLAIIAYVVRRQRALGMRDGRSSAQRLRDGADGAFTPGQGTPSSDDAARLARDRELQLEWDGTPVFVLAGAPPTPAGSGNSESESAASAPR